MRSKTLPAEDSYGRLPIYLITGFLGSGKTTLLNRLLQQPGMELTAVIVNEFGTVGIDHLLVQASGEDMVLLAGGCLCCAVRGDLLLTLEKLARQRGLNEIPPFQRVLIETSGLADPAPILRTLLNDEAVRQSYRLEGVVTTVDAVYGAAQLQEHDESAKQAALADHLVLTKTDVAERTEIQALRQRLRQLNPAARLLDAQEDEPSPATLFERQPYDPATRGLDAAAWLQAERYQAHPPRRLDSGMDAHIQSFCLQRATPLRWLALEHWLRQLTRLRGKDLLRIKGIVWTEETELPVVIQGVQHILQAPATLQRWPQGQPYTQIVFITRNLDQATIEANLEGILADPSPLGLSRAAMALLGGHGRAG
jgi:G3E family GTPase